MLVVMSSMLVVFVVLFPLPLAGQRCVLVVRVCVHAHACLSVSVIACVYVCVFLSACLSVSMFPSVSLEVSESMPLYLCLLVGVYACLCLRVSWLCTAGLSICVGVAVSISSWFVCASLYLLLCVLYQYVYLLFFLSRIYVRVSMCTSASFCG